MWPLLLVRFFKSRWVVGRVQLPYPTAWDYFFDQRKTAFMLVHLSDGHLIGGYWGGRSYAGIFPNDGDICLEAVYQLDESGRFGLPIQDTHGVLLRKEQYSYVEFFSVPSQKEQNASKEASVEPNRIEKRGFSPFSGGYTPEPLPAHTPMTQNGTLPKAPVGGTGQTGMNGATRTTPKEQE